MASVTITSKGQVTIPKAVRDRLGLRAGDKVDIYEEHGEVHLRKNGRGESPERSLPVDTASKENPFSKWKGCLPEIEGMDVDEWIEEVRGR